MSENKKINHNIGRLKLIELLSTEIPYFPVDNEICGICESENFKLLAQKDRYGLPLSFVICRRCGLIQSKKKFQSESYKVFYNEFYTGIYKSENRQDLAKEFASRLEVGKRICKLVRRKKVLDSSSKILEVGCGTGGALAAFASQGYTVLGLDIGHTAISFGSGMGINLKVGGIETLNDDDLYDVIILVRSLEHIPNIRPFVKKIGEHLTPDGIVYISVPSLDSLLKSCSLQKMNFFAQLHFAHVYFFSVGSLKRLMSTCNFEPLFINHYIDSIWRRADENKCLDLSFTDKKNYIFSLTKMIILEHAKLGLLALNFSLRVWRFITKKISELAS